MSGTLTPEQYERFRETFRLPAAPEGLTYVEAALIAWAFPDREVQISSDGWGQEGKFAFLDTPAVVLPNGDTVRGERRMFFKDFAGKVSAWAPSDAGANRADWRVGPSRGKPS